MFPFLIGMCPIYHEMHAPAQVTDHADGEFKPYYHLSIKLFGKFL